MQGKRGPSRAARRCRRRTWWMMPQLVVDDAFDDVEDAQARDQHPEISAPRRRQFAALPGTEHQQRRERRSVELTCRRGRKAGCLDYDQLRGPTVGLPRRRRPPERARVPPCPGPARRLPRDLPTPSLRLRSRAALGHALDHHARLDAPGYSGANAIGSSIWAT
jgi:hypothetical protein